jgi:hypothetical protein
MHSDRTMSATEPSAVELGRPASQLSVDKADGLGIPDPFYIDPKREAALLRKIDLYLVPLLTISFLSAYLDRSNIGNAAIAGLLPDLGMSSQQLASMISFTAALYHSLTLSLPRCCAPVLCHVRLIAT